MKATRPTQTLPEAKRNLIRQAILGSLRAGASRTTACHTAGIARQTFYNWLDQDEAFKLAVLAAEAALIQQVEAAAIQCALKATEDPRYLRFMTFFLKARAGWSEEPEPPEEQQPYQQESREVILERIYGILDNYKDDDGNPYPEKLSDLARRRPAEDSDAETSGDGFSPAPSAHRDRPALHPTAEPDAPRRDPRYGTVHAEIF